MTNTVNFTAGREKYARPEGHEGFFCQHCGRDTYHNKGLCKRYMQKILSHKLNRHLQSMEVPKDETKSINVSTMDVKQHPGRDSPGPSTDDVIPLN
jgi:hypothetical protein